MKRTAALILASTLAFACSEASTDKGAEENPLTDGKSDSFFRPTEHGALRMGVPNSGRLTDDEQFHAWTFELSDDAEVALHTEGSQNVDTVMYLYHRTSPDDSWGRYIEKNDDDGDRITSRLELQTGAGEYRVIIKGFKAALRGGFSLHGACSGDGCMVADGGSCEADSFESLPTMTQLTADCSFDLAGVLASPPRATSGGYVLLSEKCSLTGLERQAIDFYHEWWDNIAGFDEIIADVNEDVELDFQVEERVAGTVITVGAGGDEDAISFYFDEDDKLLASYQHNQSPSLDLYCGDSGPPIERLHESCFDDLKYGLQRNDESDRMSGEDSFIDVETEGDPAVAAAIGRFLEETDLEDETVVSWEMVTWLSPNDGHVASVNIIGPDDATAEYTVFEQWDGSWSVIMRADANGITFICP